MTILVLIGMVFVIIWEIFQGKISLNLVLLLGGFRWAHVFISHHKHQFKPHSSPWFSAAYAAAMVYRNHFFRLYRQNKSFESKVKFRQARNRCKRVLEAAKLEHPNKTKESITSQKLGLMAFGEFLIVFSTKVNLLYLHYSTTWRFCLLHLIKQNCLLKTFLWTLILMTQVSLYLFSLLELIWNCIMFL